MLSLTYTGQTTIPVEVEGVTPDRLRDMSLDQVSSLSIYHGNQTVPLSEFFRIEGEPSDQRLEWHGDLSGVHWIGAKMSSGEMIVHGNAGRHLGSEMTGGSIRVRGNAGDWVGGELRGGLIRVNGSAGHLVGAAYRGSRRGMRNGTILIGGDVGNELGHTMRRGLILVGGNAGDLIGFNMLAGTILVLGTTGIRHGAGMRRGTIGLFGDATPELLPSFRYGCRFRPTFLTLLYQQLVSLDLPIPKPLRESEYDLYHGDLIEGGRGEILFPAKCRTRN